MRRLENLNQVSVWDTVYYLPMPWGLYERGIVSSMKWEKDIWVKFKSPNWEKCNIEDLYI